MAKSIRLPGEAEKVFAQHIKKLTYCRATWEVWADLMFMFAATISNAFDKVHFDQREKTYLTTINKYSKEEQNTIVECFGDYVMGIDAHPFQDFLGKLYMTLELGNHWKGQFFSPYSVCKMMAQISMDRDIESQVENKGWASVCDMCCGGGAMLIAAAEVAYEHKIDFQNRILFIAQDIDPVVAHMCYIQLSLIGCPGYVKIGNSLTDPLTGNALYPPQGENIWITPMYASEVWDMRRKWNLIDSLLRVPTNSDKVHTIEPDGYPPMIDLLGNAIIAEAPRKDGNRANPTKERKKPEQQAFEEISMFDLGII